MVVADVVNGDEDALAVLLPSSLIQVALKEKINFQIVTLHEDYHPLQWFLTFFALWAPKIQNNFYGPLKCCYVLQVDPLIPVKEV